MTETHDPWATVKRFHVQPRPDDARLVHHVEAGEGQPAGFYMWAQDVDAARAAVERQHAAALAEKDKEIADLKRRRVTKREQREWDDIQGEALTLRSYIREQGETPMMTASRAERAEADLTTLCAQVETLTAERDELWGANHLNANALRLKSTSLAAVEGRIAEQIAAYVESCREDDSDRRRVQVFDVLASHIRKRWASPTQKRAVVAGDVLPTRNSTIAVNGQRLDCVESLAITSSVDGLMRVTLTLIGVSVEGWTPPQPVAAPQEEP